jgi:hypothetical protein
LKVVYIGGYSRSGSTLLLRLLAESEGLVAVGELFDIWARSFGEDQLCGCGKSFHACPFWRAVTIEAFGVPPEQVPAERYGAQRRRVQGHPSIPRLWMPMLRSAGYQRELGRYVGLLKRLYESVSEVSGDQIVLDSSKVPQYSWVLAEMMPAVELHMIHLVRDSRAAAFSWRKIKLRPEISWKAQAMDRHSVARSALEWDLFNLMLWSRRHRYSSYTVVRYEDLTLDPAAELLRISQALGSPLTPVVSEESRHVHLGTGHTVSGNPSRFDIGPVKIERDDEWLDNMRPRDRYVATALSVPGLRRYGYGSTPWRTPRGD